MSARTLLIVSGSLRAASSNSAAARAAAQLAPPGATATVFDGIGALPHFNPDLDVEPAHPAVASWRRALAGAQAVLLSSPEYAHGVPGVLKNALDWVVGSGELVDRPIALLNASPRATHAHAALVEILTVMNAHVVHDAMVAVPISGHRLDDAGILADPALTAPIRAALATLLAAAPAEAAP